MPTDPQPLETALYPPGIAIGWEDLTKLEELAAGFIAEHRPQTPTERSLVDALIHTEWMLRRYRWLETELWNTARQSLPPDQRTRSWPGHAFVAQPEIGRIHRMRASAQKSFLDLLAQLRRLQSERIQAPPDADLPQTAVPAESEPTVPSGVDISRPTTKTRQPSARPASICHLRFANRVAPRLPPPPNPCSSRRCHCTARPAPTRPARPHSAATNPVKRPPPAINTNLRY